MIITECRCPQCEADHEERDEYEDAPEIEWAPISDDELAERLAWFWEPKEGE